MSLIDRLTRAWFRATDRNATPPMGTPVPAELLWRDITPTEVMERDFRTDFTDDEPTKPDHRRLNQ